MSFDVVANADKEEVDRLNWQRQGLSQMCASADVHAAETTEAGINPSRHHKPDSMGL